MEYDKVMEEGELEKRAWTSDGLYHILPMAHIYIHLRDHPFYDYI